jgi:ribonuclease-3
MDLEQFQDRIGVRFDDIGLLRQALTHRSFVNEQFDDGIEDNERLEFLGDAILDYVTADLLYLRFPEMAEGVMTRLRSALVKTGSLAQLAAECGIGDMMRIGRGEERSGGRERPTNLCNVFEAVVGAIYLDQGMETVKGFVVPRLTELQKDVMEEAIRKDARSQLQEWSQAIYSATPVYHLKSASGPEHRKQFEIEVFILETPVAVGIGRTKAAAAQDAAREALMLIEEGTLQSMVPLPADDAETNPDVTADT